MSDFVIAVDVNGVLRLLHVGRKLWVTFNGKGWEPVGRKKCTPVGPAQDEVRVAMFTHLAFRDFAPGYRDLPICALRTLAEQPRELQAVQAWFPKVRYCVRVVRADEGDAEMACHASNYSVAHTPEGHIKTGSRCNQSNWFSASAIVSTPEAARQLASFVQTLQKKFPREKVGVVVFDLHKVRGIAVPWQTLDQQRLGVAKNFAASKNELVFNGFVPQDAVVFRREIGLPVVDGVTVDFFRDAERFVLARDALEAEELVARTAVEGNDELVRQDFHMNSTVELALAAALAETRWWFE